MRNLFVAAAGAALAGCASSAAEISPSYVSPMLYQHYTCPQLTQEAQAVSARAAQVAGVQDGKRTNDAVMTTVGVVIFWPALFAVKGDGATAAELGQLKGQMQAIEQASIMKKCGIQFTPNAPPPGAPGSRRSARAGDLREGASAWGARWRLFCVMSRPRST